jgi:hypothetical protein
MKDLVIGAIQNLEYGVIVPWAKSLRDTGYDGDIVILYNLAARQQRANEEGFSTKAFEEYRIRTIWYEGPNLDNSNFMWYRFFMIWQHLWSHPDIYSNVLITDVSDVKFQTNPTGMLRDVFAGKNKIMVSSENFTYENEPWSNRNMRDCYGVFHFNEKLREEIYCAGVIAGKAEYISDLCKILYLVSKGGQQSTNGGGPDQAALNIILTSKPWLDVTFFSRPVLPNIVHLGTSMPAIESGSGDIGYLYTRGQITPDQLKFASAYQPKLINGVWVTPDNEPYCVVHQYNRVKT